MEQTQPEDQAALADGVRKVILPERLIETAKGFKLTIKPWGIKHGDVFLEQIEKFSHRLVEAQTPDAEGVLKTAWVDCLELVRLTIGWSAEEMEERLYAEDILVLTQAIIEICLVRDDGRGALKPFGVLVSLATQLVIAMNARKIESPRTQ
jgi:hypothetical protein